MKIAAFTAAAMITATSAMAADLGGGLSIGAELDNKYNIDTEKFTMTVTPEVGYSAWGAGFTLGADINLYNGDEFAFNEDKMPTLDFGAEYGIGLWGLSSTAYAETGYDLEAEEMSDIEIGLKFAF